MIGFCGLRHLPTPLPSAPITAALGQGGDIATGCCLGTDQAVIRSVLASGHADRLTIFAAFGPTGAGSCSLSAVADVIAAQHAGADVRWLAGGELCVPLRGRLAQRSLAMIRHLARHRGSLVAIATAPPRQPFGPGPFPACGSGTWATVAAASLMALPITVIMPGDTFEPPALPTGGSWALLADDILAWRWVPAQVKMIL